MPRPKSDLNYLESIPIIHDFLSDDHPLKPKRVRRYLLDLAVVYPYILEKYQTFDVFLAEKATKKSVFLNKFVENEFNKRMKQNPQQDMINCKNRVLQIQWNFQGFLGYLSTEEERDLRAVSKLLDLQTDNPNFVPTICVLDLLNLYDELPGEGRRRLKTLFWTTWNPIDAVQLRLNDFKLILSDYGDEVFWVKKYRQKTMRKRIVYITTFEKRQYEEFERYCNRNGIGPNDPIFSRLDTNDGKRYSLGSSAMKAYFGYWIHKCRLNENVMPKTIRSLGITQLEPIFKDDKELLDVWSQHKMGIVTQHYVKNTLNRLINHLPQIRTAVGIENVSYLTEEVKVLKEDINTKLNIHDQEIQELKQQRSTAAQEVAKETAQEILHLIKKETK